LQDFVSDDGIVTQAAKIAMKNARGLKIESLKLWLANTPVGE
jgi:hypothetical protein